VSSRLIIIGCWALMGPTKELIDESLKLPGLPA
jgi:hypothetical protein